MTVLVSKFEGAGMTHAVVTHLTSRLDDQYLAAAKRLAEETIQDDAECFSFQIEHQLKEIA